jgi:quinol monooxygenase YgiN
LERGCINIHLFESLRLPSLFAIHSEWVDEEAFELHAKLPHTVRFVEAAKELLTDPIEGLRARHLTGGPGGGVAGGGTPHVSAPDL